MYLCWMTQTAGLKTLVEKKVKTFQDEYIYYWMLKNVRIR